MEYPGDTAEPREVAAWMGWVAKTQYGLPAILPVMTSAVELTDAWTGPGDVKDVPGYLNNVDHCSVGYMQQQADDLGCGYFGWGTYKQIIQAPYALKRFCEEAAKLKDYEWHAETDDRYVLGRWCQAVQRSAYPEAYGAKGYDIAIGLLGQEEEKGVGVTSADLVEAARSFIGAPYKFWTGAYPEYGPPGYMDAQAPGYYYPDWVKRQGVHCSGFLNLVRMECGLSPIGLTRQWEDWAWEVGGVAFDPNSPGEAGAVCVKGWTGGMGAGAEGHVALYTGEHTLIQAVPGYGVYEGEMDYDSHAYIGYAAYATMPEVSYGAVGVKEPAAPLEGVRYLGLSKGWVNVNGDYDQGWIPAEKLRVMKPSESYADV